MIEPRKDEKKITELKQKLMFHTSTIEKLQNKIKDYMHN